MPVVSIVDNLISYGAALNATDIHIEPLTDAVLIRFRVDGILREMARLPIEVHLALIARVKILSNMQIDEHSKPQDGRMKYKRGSEMFDIRVAIMPTFYGEKVTMRLLLAAQKPLSFAELGMTQEQIAVLERNIKRTFGMILSTGPTSSGKTTTQYSILSYLNKPEVNIVTIEDPIEYELRYINQTQINPKAGIDFALGLRAFLRHDPNIIMVGEIRDQETAEIATHAAMTGHLVLSTLHTNDAAGAIPRLSEMGVPNFLIASTVNVIIAQRLVRKICQNCIQSYNLAQEDIIQIEKQFKFSDIIQSLKKNNEIDSEDLSLNELHFFKGKGCVKCGYRGYKGRIGIYEILENNQQLAALISKNATREDIYQYAIKNNLITLPQDGFIKAKQGLTTIEEILRVTKE